MTRFRFAVALAASLLCAGAAHAATMTNQFQAFSHFENNDPNMVPEHSVWFAGGNSPHNAGGNHFLFENGSPGFGLFTTFDDATATLTGEVVNGAGTSYTLSLFLEEVADPGAYKPGPQKIIDEGIDTNSWTFYKIRDGASDPMSTLIYNGAAGNIDSFEIKQRGMPLQVQVGVGANDKNWNLFGLSTWIKFHEISCNGAYGHVDACGKTYDGDINILLAPVPLPASLSFALLGLGGLGLAARRRRRA